MIDAALFWILDDPEAFPHALDRFELCGGDLPSLPLALVPGAPALENAGVVVVSRVVAEIEGLLEDGEDV